MLFSPRGAAFQPQDGRSPSASLEAQRPGEPSSSLVGRAEAWRFLPTLLGVKSGDPGFRHQPSRSPEGISTHNKPQRSPSRKEHSVSTPGQERGPRLHGDHPGVQMGMSCFWSACEPLLLLWVSSVGGALGSQVEREDEWASQWKEPLESLSSAKGGLWVSLPELRFPFRSLLAVWPRASYFTFLCLRFLFCKMGMIITVPTP